MSRIFFYDGGAYGPVGSGVISVLDYGATGDGVTDDTAAINAALTAAAAFGVRTVLFPDGTYMIRAHDSLGRDPRTDPTMWDGGIRPLTGTRMVLSHGATLQAITNNQPHSKIVMIYEANRVEISGGRIVGDRTTHTGVTGEWGHGISILGSTDVWIHDIEITNCWGDGINTLPSGPQSSPTLATERLVVERVVCDNNRRQGISVSSGIGVTIRDSTFSGTNGTAPEAGIDIESNGAALYTHDILITGCRLIDNNGAGFLMTDGACDRITFAHNYLAGNVGAGTYTGQIKSWVGADKTIALIGNRFGTPGGSIPDIDLNGGRYTITNNRCWGGGGVLLTNAAKSLIADNDVAPSAANDGITIDRGGTVTVKGNRVTGGANGIRLAASATNCDRLSITGNRITGASSASVYIDAPTTNVLVNGNEAWSNGAGVVFDTGLAHTGHRVDTTWDEGADTLPA